MAEHRLFFHIVACTCIAMLVQMLAPLPSVHAGGITYIMPGGAGDRTGASWQNAKDLQAALTDASSGEQLWVKAGTYKPTNDSFDLHATFQLKSGVAIYGGFAGTETRLSQRNMDSNPTILSGDIDNNDAANPAAFTYQVRGSNSYHIVTGNYTDSTAVLDGFTITGGSANAGVFPDDRGAGMANMENASPTLNNLIFSGNSAGYGAGMMNVRSSPTIKNVVFSGNSASTNGGAIYNHFSSNSTFTNVTFIANSATYAGGAIVIAATSNPTFRNVVFSGNYAGQCGGAIATNDTIATLVNVTFSGNSAGTAGGICNQVGSNLTIRNSIVWNNSGGEIVNINSAAEVQYSLIKGGYSGAGNISSDPRFITSINPGSAPAIAGDLHLRSNSPAVDAGTNNAVVDSKDRDGKQRIIGPNVDMGAYEQQFNIIGSPPSAATYGTNYNYSFSTIGLTNVTFAIAGTIPPGLSFESGVLSGIPTAVGTFANITVTASGAEGAASLTFAIQVKKAVLTVAADDQHKQYHTANPPLTASYSGFVLGDTAAALHGSPTLTTNATLLSPVGQYPITPTLGTLSAANYNFAFVTGTLSVEPGSPRPPIVTSFTLNGGAATTTSRDVVISATVTDPDSNPSNLLVSFSNDGTNWNDWQPYSATSPWQLISGDGVKTVYGRFKTSAGDVSAVVSDTIELNTSVQDTYGMTVNEAALYTNQVTVELTISAKPGTAEMQVSNDGGFFGSTWEPYAAHKTWEITRYGNYVTPRIVYVRFRDVHSTISPTYQDDVLLDVVPPTGEVQVIPDSNMSVASPSIQLRLKATDDLSGVGAMRLSSQADFANASWIPFASSATWNTTSGSSVYVQFRDHAGNVSQIYTAFLAGQKVIWLPIVRR